MNWLMKNIMLSLMTITQTLSQLPGSQLDDHGCVLDGGYQWCESHNECIRPWETVCEVDTPAINLPINLPIDLNPVDPIPLSLIPYNCASWYDGCNTCSVENGVISLCTLMMCFVNNPTECLSYYSNLNEGDICYRFCEDGSQETVNRQSNCPSGSECTPPNTISYDSCNDNAWKCISGH